MADLIQLFSTWTEGFAGATVSVYKANTTVLASLFSDVDGTIPAANPQQLGTLSVSGLNFGKFVNPVYVNESYFLSIDDGTQTGVIKMPVFSLSGADGSGLLVTAEGGSVATPLSEIAARIVFAEDYGPIDAVSSAANTTTITAAIGAAAARGGGYVLLPAGIIPFTTISLPAGVILCGAGQDVTFLQSQEAEAVVTITGDYGGIWDLTLDGVNLAANSIGLKLRSVQHIRLSRFTLKRFETGVDAKGLKFSEWKQTTLSNCATNLKLYGDSTDSGAECQFNRWENGICELATTCGIDISFEDKEVSFNHFHGILFDSNIKAIRCNGGRFTDFDDCEFTNNATIFDVLDDTATTGNNKVLGFAVTQSLINSGSANFRDTCGDVKFLNCDLQKIDFTLTTPKNAIVFKDCVEDALVTIAGDGTKIVRNFTNLPGATRGVTTGTAATKMWSLKLAPGEMASGHAFVTAKQRNGTDKATYVFTWTAQRAPSTLAYDAQTANFTVGNVLTGGTSKATGQIIADADGGTTGTLTLHTITGDFIDNEIITDGAGGSATVNGALVAGSVSVLDQDLQSGSETDATWDCVAAGSTEELEIRGTGASGKTIDWNVMCVCWRFG